MALPPSTTTPEATKRLDQDAKQQDALLREVDDAYRQDQLTLFAKNHGTKVGAAVIGGLALLAGWQLWSHYSEQGHEENSEELVKAMDQLDAGNLDTANKALADIEKEGSAGAIATAKLSRAAVALQQNRPGDAIRLYGEVANDGDAPQAYRDLALIRQVSLDYERMKPADVVTKMKPLAKPDSPFFGSAGELLGAAYLDLGKPELAGPLFAQIAKDETVPNTLRSRARQLAGLMGVDAIDDVDKALKDLNAEQEGAPPAGAQ